MQLLGLLALAGASLLALPGVQGYCPQKDRIMISGWFQFGDQCIGISHRVRMNFQQAQFFCGRYGGSLYALDSPQKNRIMLSYLTTIFGQGRRQKFWTGYYKLENALGWRWTSGSRSRYTDWEPGKPASTNEAIGAVAWGGTYYWQHTWQDEPLSASFAFICQSPALGIQRPLPTTPAPPTTPMLPTVGPGGGPGFGPGAGPGVGPGFGPGAGPGAGPGVGPGTPGVNPGRPGVNPGRPGVNPGTPGVNPRQPPFGGNPRQPPFGGNPRQPPFAGNPRAPGNRPGTGRPTGPVLMRNRDLPERYRNVYGNKRVQLAIP